MAENLPPIETIGDALVIRRSDEACEEQVESVRFVRLRPISEPDGPIALRCGKEELALWWRFDELPPDLQDIARKDLAARYPIPRITAIRQARLQRGNRMLFVDTEAGPTSFLIRDPLLSVVSTGPDAVQIKDLAGNRYRIDAISALDARSRFELDKVL
jgi:hypothetical protein